MFDTVQGLILLALWVVTLVVKVFAFIDCIRRPAEAFPAVGRQSKVLWLILTGISALTKDEFFVVTNKWLFTFDTTTWGWIHLIVGIVLSLVQTAASLLVKD